LHTTRQAHHHFVGQIVHKLCLLCNKLGRIVEIPVSEVTELYGKESLVNISLLFDLELISVAGILEVRKSIVKINTVDVSPDALELALEDTKRNRELRDTFCFYKLEQIKKVNRELLV